MSHKPFIPEHVRLPEFTVRAIILGVVTVGVLSFLADQFFHWLDVYPAPGEPMFDPALNVLVLSYRFVFEVLAGYVVARLAPHSPMQHVRLLGLIGTCLAVVGAVASIPMGIAPAWTQANGPSRLKELSRW